MNKKEIIKQISVKTGYSQKDITEVIESFLYTITDELARGNDVSLTGFGKFVVQERAARNGVNPKTGEKIQIAATKTPKFKASSTLKNAVK